MDWVVVVLIPPIPRLVCPRRYWGLPASEVEKNWGKGGGALV